MANFQKINESEKKEYMQKYEYEENLKNPMMEAAGHNYEFKNTEKEIEEARKKFYPPNQVSLLSEHEQHIASDFRLRQTKYTKYVSEFTNHHLMQFDYKQTKCMLERCYDDLSMPKIKVKNCNEKCTGKGKHFHDFIKNKLDSNQDNFNLCLENSNKKSNIQYFNKMIDCYDNYFKEFDQIKFDVEKEQRFYRA